MVTTDWLMFANYELVFLPYRSFPGQVIWGLDGLSLSSTSRACFQFLKSEQIIMIYGANCHNL